MRDTGPIYHGASSRRARRWAIHKSNTPRTRALSSLSRDKLKNSGNIYSRKGGEKRILHAHFPDSSRLPTCRTGPLPDFFRRCTRGRWEEGTDSKEDSPARGYLCTIYNWGFGLSFRFIMAYR
ncbi:hypothetical protein Zmor_010370 [Zophobas morio]|uniref:Uncharacterized protein n=1 Tax=Zophobas morio TaxID=2755281 RepID=A0AA38MJR7_9CUCU|nr:hypothetical protein Zmor_010370 [Zophobas morio]